MSVTVKNEDDIRKMRVAGKLAAEVLDFITPHVQPGVTTEEIDRLCHDYMVNVQDTVPAPLNYVVNIDITVIKEGYHGDTSRMFYVGEPSIQAKRLCEITYQSMWKGIREVRPGARLGDIGFSIQQFAESHGFSIVREFCGHGIGKVFHEEPQVLHYGKKGTGFELKEGMTFTIEPMVNAGKKDIRMMPDGWTVVTKDRSLSAQWEHTILVTKDGYEVLTVSEHTPPPFLD